MKNYLKKIILILLMCYFTIAFVVNIVSYASDPFDLNQFGEDATPTNVTDAIDTTAKTVITMVRVISIAIAIIMLLVIAMRYMVSAPGDRADIKKHAVNYVIGAFILFGVSGILTILINFSDVFNETANVEEVEE